MADHLAWFKPSCIVSRPVPYSSTLVLSKSLKRNISAFVVFIKLESCLQIFSISQASARNYCTLIQIQTLPEAQRTQTIDPIQKSQWIRIEELGPHLALSLAGVVSQAFNQSTLPPDNKMGRQTLGEVHSHTLLISPSSIHCFFTITSCCSSYPNILNCWSEYVDQINQTWGARFKYGCCDEK